MALFRKNKFICIVERDANEPQEHFIERGNFIVGQKPKNDAEYNKAITYSYVFINNKYLKCEYGADVMHELRLMIKN
jgi:hypothetical protein